MKKSELKALIREVVQESGQVPYEQLPQEYKDLLSHMDNLFIRKPNVRIADQDAIKASLVDYLRKNGWKKSI